MANNKVQKGEGRHF